MEDEKASPGSQPLLDEPLDSESESGFAEESIWQRKDDKGTTTRRDDARRLKIIIFALSVAYIPLLVLYLMLLLPQIKSCRPRDSNVRPSGLFPCEFIRSGRERGGEGERELSLTRKTRC